MKNEWDEMKLRVGGDEERVGLSKRVDEERERGRRIRGEKKKKQERKR